MASGSASSPVQVTKNGGVLPQESADGRFIYYAGGQAASVWRVPASGGEEREVTGPISNPANFTVAQKGIYFIPPPDRDGHSRIQFFSFATEKLRTIAPIDKNVVDGWGMSVSPDERWILYTQLDQLDWDLMLVENFR